MPAPYPENPPSQPVEIQGEPAEGFHYLKAFAYGLGAALVGAFLWAKLSQALPFGIGFVAIFLGMGVAIAVKVGAENRSGPLLPVIGVLLCGFSVLLGNVMMVYEIASRDPSAASLPVVLGVRGCGKREQCRGHHGRCVRCGYEQACRHATSL